MTRGTASCLPPHRELAPPREDHLPGRTVCRARQHLRSPTTLRPTSQGGLDLTHSRHCGFVVVPRPLTLVGANPALDAFTDLAAEFKQVAETDTVRSGREIAQVVARASTGTQGA